MSEYENSSFAVYKPIEIAQKLRMSERSVYNFCNSTSQFKVLRMGGLIRIEKESFDNWFHEQRNQLQRRKEIPSVISRNNVFYVVYRAKDEKNNSKQIWESGFADEQEANLRCAELAHQKQKVA